MSIVMTNVIKRLKRKTVLDIDKLEIGDGRIVALCGENGSGKTMLLRAIAGLIKPNQGSITINDALLWRDIMFPPSVGILIESPSFINTETGFANLSQLSRIRSRINDNDVKKSMCDVGLDPESRAKFRQYSLGMKQSLGIAAAIMEHPELVLLDEPTNALDEAGVFRLQQIIMRLRSEKTTVVIASHDASFVKAVADDVVRLRGGKIIA